MLRRVVSSAGIFGLGAATALFCVQENASTSHPFIVEAAAASTGLPANRTAEIMKFGFPGMDNVRYRQGYVLSYDRRNRTANWVVEHVSSDLLKQNNANRQESDFREDDADPPIFRAKNSDYRKSGFDRGHLAAAANHRYAQSAMDETFYLSNMSPQVGKGFNRDKWNELETYARDRVKSSKNVWICTGPLYRPYTETDGSKWIRYKVIGESNVAVPTHFFKIIVCEAHNGVLSAESYILPNVVIPDSTPISVFKVPLIEVEKASGFLFFDKIPNKYSIA
eukprot:Opistho-2@83952